MPSGALPRRLAHPSPLHHSPAVVCERSSGVRLPPRLLCLKLLHPAVELLAEHAVARKAGLVLLHPRCTGTSIVEDFASRHPDQRFRALRDLLGSLHALQAPSQVDSMG